MGVFYENNKSIIEIHKINNFFPTKEIDGIHIPVPNEDRNKAIQNMYDLLSKEAKNKLVEQIKKAVQNKLGRKAVNRIYDLEDYLITQYNNILDACFELNISSYALFLTTELRFADGRYCFPFIENMMFKQKYDIFLSSHNVSKINEAISEMTSLCVDIINHEVYEYALYDKKTLKQVAPNKIIFGRTGLEQITKDFKGLKYVGEYSSVECLVKSTGISKETNTHDEIRL